MTAHLYAKDVRAIRRHADELLRQCDHFERNGSGDEIRFGHMLNEAIICARAAQRAYKRFHRERGWQWHQWWRL